MTRSGKERVRRVLALMGKRFPDEGLFGDDVELARFVDSFRVSAEGLGGGAIRWRAS